MQDLKIGRFLKASPKAQVFGGLIGSIVGALISLFIYRMHTSVYQQLGLLFPISQAYVWILAARLVTGKRLPKMLGEFAVHASAIFTVSTVVRIYLGIISPRGFVNSSLSFLAVSPLPLECTILLYPHWPERLEGYSLVVGSILQIG